jgi:hypothetical protein
MGIKFSSVDAIIGLFRFAFVMSLCVSLIISLCAAILMIYELIDCWFTILFVDLLRILSGCDTNRRFNEIKMISCRVPGLEMGL